MEGNIFPENKTRAEKIEQAEMSVAKMFDENMEAIGRIKENPYFNSPSDRGF